MMKSFFRALERERVPYLLVGGQACILYGASHFTEDVDLWVRPDRVAFRRLIRALASLRAKVYKLTPPLEPRFIKRGHGFHFHVGPDLFIDVMGVPPRAGSFRQARLTARHIRTDWGIVPVLAPQELVKLKRTNRPADYEAISNLVRYEVDEHPTPKIMRWALETTFQVEDLAEFIMRAAAIPAVFPKRPAVRALRSLRGEVGDVDPRRLQRAAELLTTEMGELMNRGRRYWTPVIADLRRLRSEGRLLREGTPVADVAAR